MVENKLDQCMKPHGEEGIKTIENMNENHKEIHEFALECIDVGENDRILDIGCGGGINIERFLKLTKNNVDGLDYSDVSVKESIKRNQKAVDENRCKIIQANVIDIPLNDEKYDIVAAFETIYFWPDIENTFKKISKIITDNGKFMIAQGTDGSHPDDEKFLEMVEGMSIYTADDLTEMLYNADFKDIKIFKKEDDHILVVIAEK